MSENVYCRTGKELDARHEPHPHHRSRHRILGSQHAGFRWVRMEILTSGAPVKSMKYRFTVLTVLAASCISSLGLSHCQAQEAKALPLRATKKNTGTLKAPTKVNSSATSKARSVGQPENHNDDDNQAKVWRLPVTLGFSSGIGLNVSPDNRDNQDIPLD
jgi:hypothetical protein